MSAAMVNLGIYGIVRVGDGLLGGGPAWWWLLVMALGALSALFGSLHSATSTDLKRLLAYSTTDNVGLMLLGVGASGLFASTGHRALRSVALVAALLHVVFHAVFKGSLFLSASSLQQATGTRDLDRLGGLMRRMPVTGLAVPRRRSGHRRPAAAVRLRERMAAAPGHAARASLVGPVASAIAMPIGVGVLALTGGLTAADVRQGDRHRPPRPAAERAGRPGARSAAVDVGRRRDPGRAVPASSAWPRSWSSRPWSTRPAASPAAVSQTRWSAAGRWGSRASTACSPRGCSLWGCSSR